MARTRVLHVAKRFWPFVGGQERYVLDLARAQTRAGHRCRVLTPDRDLVGGAPGRLAAHDRVDDVGVRRVRVVGGAAKQVIAQFPTTLLREIRWADVVHHHDPRFALESTLLAAAMFGRPVILHTHGLFFHTERAARVKRWLMRWYYGPLFRAGVARIVAGSRVDERLVAELCGLGPDRLRYIPHGIGLDRFAPNGARAALPEHGQLLIAGRVAEHKGHDRAIDALANVEGPWRLAIAGGGQPRAVASLEQRAKDLGLADRIQWLGELRDEELVNWFRRAQLVLFPSRFEGFGLALLEALASGASVLASDIAAHEEILRGPELEDLLVDFDDTRGAAERITRELSTHAPGAAARRAAGIARAGEFSVDRMAEQIESLYRDVL